MNQVRKEFPSPAVCIIAPRIEFLVPADRSETICYGRKGGWGQFLKHKKTSTDCVPLTLSYPWLSRNRIDSKSAKNIVQETWICVQCSSVLLKKISKIHHHIRGPMSSPSGLMALLQREWQMSQLYEKQNLSRATQGLTLYTPTHKWRRVGLLKAKSNDDCKKKEWLDLKRTWHRYLMNI